MKINKYSYNEDKDILELMDDKDFLDLDGLDSEEEEGYDQKTGEYYWTDMSYYRIPQKTNHFIFEEKGDEEDPLFD